MDIREAIDGWLEQMKSQEAEKQAQVAPVNDDDPPMPAGARLLIDGKATRKSILDTVKNSVIRRFPVEDDKYRLELLDVDYDGPTHYTLAQQKQAILHNRKLGCSLKGTWRLTDKETGKVLEEKRDAVMRVPYYTNRGTIINNGSEYTVISQARLSPGVYTRKKQNGDLESQFNVANGKGFRLTLDKSTGRMNFRMGQANLPLYPVLRAMGITDEQLAKSWGHDVALANAEKNDPKTIQRLYEKIAGYKMDPLMTPQNQTKFIKDELSKFGLDPHTVVRTLGIENVKGVTPEVLLRASQKLLNVNRGIEEPDNRDNPRFSKFYGIEHMLGERIDKDAAKLLKPMLFRIRRDRNLSRIGRNALGPYIDDFLSTSGLAQPGEEANPMSILIQQSRITRTGEGGISSPDLITPEARGVQGDYLGFVDFIATPESSSAGVDVRAAYGTVLGKDNKLYNVFRNMQTGKKEYLSLDAAADKVIAFPDQDPKAPYMYVMKNGVPGRVKTSEVDYMVPSFSRTLGAGINMNPMPTAVFGQRSFYSSKFWEQYLPQKEGEVPLVDSLMPDGKMTFNEYYGRRSGCITAPFSGTVTKVTKDEITVTGKNGKTETFDIVSNLPYNRMTQLSLMPLVKKGMEVKEGDILAHSNFTDAKTGAFNMGRNLKVAILPGPRGANSFEDACIISEDAAKKLATSRMYNFDQDTKNGVSIGKNKFLAAFPDEFTKEQADTLDDSGVVKVGTELHRGDPIIAAIGPKLLSAEDAQLGKLSSVLKRAVTNKSQTWNHDWPGVVTDVVAGPNGAKVLIKSEPPVKVGDKLSPRFALKGVTGTILPMDKMPRDAQTNEPYDMIVNPMGFLSRVAPGQLMEIALGKVAKKTGRQIRIPQLPPEGGWLNWTKQQLADAGVSDTADVFDPQTGRTIKNVGDGYMYVQAMHHLAEKKYSARGIEGGYTQDQQPAKGGETGAKKISGFDVNALLSHGATEVLRDAITTRGQCFDASTEVLTRRGWVHWDEVCSDDEFLTKDKYGDNSARYEHALGFVKYHYEGELYGYENRHLDWLVTPDHSLWGINCLVSRKKPYRRYRTFQAADAFGKEGVIETFGHVYPGSIPSDSTVQFLRSSGSKRNEKELSIRLHDYCAFMGWWLSEGCARYDGARGIIVISQDEYANYDNFKEIQALGRRMGLGSGTLICKSGGISFGSTSPADVHVGIKWYSKPLAMHLMQFGSRAWDKRIPELIFEAPVECRQAFLDSFIKGDGCESQTGSGSGHVYWHIGTTSINLMNDLQRLASITGYAAFTGLDAKAGTYGHKHAYYRVILSKNTTEATIRKNPAAQFKGHYKLPYSGMVYCATMSTGLLYVRRNGKCMWSGNCNEEYWRKLRLGLPIPEPGVPFIYQKFLNNLRAGGINVVEKGDITSLMPQTDAAIEKLTEGRIIDSAQMVDSSMNPVKGGLFDLGKTGGAGGMRWSMIELPEPVPNPVMEEPVRRVLGLTSKKMSDILSGREQLNGKTGGQAIKDALSEVNVDKLIEQARNDIKSKRGSSRDNAVKVLGYLTSAKEMKIRPEEWMISKVPVIPPAFRPISKIGDVALVPDTNELYKELLENKHNYELLRKDLPDEALTDERLNIYKSVKAAFGLGNSITTEGQAKNLKGPIRQIIGTVPKWGQFQSKVVAKNQDLVGRSVTVPDKNLSMDQVGIPEDMAWTMYKPFVTRKLVQRGYSPVDVAKMIEDRTPTARHILDDVMNEKPVLMDRAPTWHKFNIMAFKPFITDGKEIRVCPMIDSGYNMDHDGDFSRSPYIITWISDKFFDTLAIDPNTNLCYNPCITKQVIQERAMYKENAVVNGVESNGTVVSLRWDEFPHYDNPTVNSHPNANFYLVPDGVAVRAYDEKQGKIVWAPVKYWSHHGVNQKLEIVTVELSSGRQILTDDDPRGVYGIDPETMEFGRWRPKDAVGKFVPRCIKDDLQEGVICSVPIGCSARERQLPDMPLDRSSGWFLGAMTGDGWDSMEHGASTGICFCYDRKYNDLGSAFRSSMLHSMCGGLDAPIHEQVNSKEKDPGRYGDAIKLTFNSQAAGRFIHATIGHGAENKHLPPFWQRASREFRLGLFEGLMDTDGTIAMVKAKAKKNCQLMCNYTSVSLTLATEVQYLCRTLGIDSKLTTQKTPKGGKCWQVSISTKNLKSLGLDLKSPHKAKALADAEIKSDTSAGGRKYMVPVPVNDLKKISGIILALDKSAYVTLNRTSKMGYVPTTIADKIAKVLKGAPELQTDLWKKWLELYSNIDSVVWERVEGFTCTGMYEDGFDLTVPGYETFMNSEGIILSNTVNIHVPASEKASREALEKMLPSKNLLSLTDMTSVRYKPEKEQVSGLWALTAGVTNKKPRVFGSKEEAIRAYRDGEIGPNDPITILPLKKKAQAVGETWDGQTPVNPTQTNTAPKPPKPPKPPTPPKPPAPPKPPKPPKPNISHAQALELEKRRRRANAAKIREQGKWYNKAKNWGSEAWEGFWAARDGAIKDLAENGAENVTSGVTSMATGLMKGLADVPGMLAGGIAALGTGLTGNGFGTGWEAGRNFVDEHIGIGNYDLAHAKRFLKQMGDENKLEYMERNGIDPENMSTLDRLSTLGLTTAGASGEAIGNYVGFGKGMKALGATARLAGGVGGKILQATNAGAGLGRATTAVGNAVRPALEFGKNVVNPLMEAGSRAVQPVMTYAGRAVQPAAGYLSRVAQPLSGYATDVVRPALNVGKNTFSHLMDAYMVQQTAQQAFDDRADMITGAIQSHGVGHAPDISQRALSDLSSQVRW